MMFRTATLQSSAKARNGGIKSLALSVYFKQPDFGMKRFEILSRATTFLLAVDPPDEKPREGKYAFLDEHRQQREARQRLQNYAHEPAGGPRRHVQSLSWLEYCPKKFRPVVHCVAASHVLAPWKWGNYYTQPWLQQVKAEHCVYSLEVYDKHKPLAKFALNPYPIHHPEGRDLALIHLKEEEEALAQLQKLGVDILYRRDDETPFEKGQDIVFDGFVVTEDNTTNQDDFSSSNHKMNPNDNDNDDDDDTRIFLPYTETGQLLFGNSDRFLASTPTPLPEGLCGGPAIDQDGKVCGVVEGVVPEHFDDEKMAGAASFIPSIRLGEFIDYAEEIMLKEIFPTKMYDMVVDYKRGLGREDVEYNMDDVVSEESEQKETKAMQTKLGSAFEDRIESLKNHHTMEEVNAILTTIRRERDEVMDIWNREGGDLDEIIARVRAKTRQTQMEILASLSEKEKQEMQQNLDKRGDANVQEAQYEEKEGSS